MTSDDVHPAAPTLSMDTSQDSLNSESAGEDQALSLLKQADLAAQTIEELSKNPALLKSRKVRLAIVGHPRAPRHVSLALLRQLFTFDLMQVALLPTVAGDIKKAAEDALINRLESVTLGERLSLARRSSGRVASVLLGDKETRVTSEALENPRLTELLILRALNDDASQHLVHSVCQHPKWSTRREIRSALLRSEHIPLSLAFEFMGEITPELRDEILHSSRLSADAKAYLRNLSAGRR